MAALKRHYATAVTLTAERLATALFVRQSTAPAAVLARVLHSGDEGFDAKVQVSMLPKFWYLKHQHLHFALPARGDSAEESKANTFQLRRQSAVVIMLQARHAVQAAPFLSALDEVVQGLAQALEPRVYVSLCRGLWELTAKDVFLHLISLQEEGDTSQVSIHLMYPPVIRL